MSSIREKTKLGQLALIIFVASGAAACGSLEQVSSGRIGCSPNDITISDDSSGWNTRSWVATCHGKDYFCSAASSPYGSNVDCKPRAD